MDGAPVNVTDIAVLAVVVVSGVFAFVRGFVHELLAIGAALRGPDVVASGDIAA